MFKPNVLKLVLYVVVAGGFLFLALNAHMDIYPCQKSSYEYARRRCSLPSSSTCDFLAVRRSGQFDCPATLTAGGWMVAILVHGILPYPVVAAAGHFLRRRKEA